MLVFEKGYYFLLLPKASDVYKESNGENYSIAILTAGLIIDPDCPVQPGVQVEMLVENPASGEVSNEILILTLSMVIGFGVMNSFLGISPIHIIFEGQETQTVDSIYQVGTALPAETGFVEHEEKRLDIIQTIIEKELDQKSRFENVLSAVKGFH